MAQAANRYAPPVKRLGPGQKHCYACGEPISKKATVCPHPKCLVLQRTPVSKTVLLLVTFFFGGFGVHKFYLGKYWQGTLYLLFFWTWIPAVFALIEFIIYAFTSSESLNAKYSAHGSTVAVVAVGAVVGVTLIGILAAVALPAYQDYTKRARVSQTLQAAQAWRAAVEHHYARSGKLPSSTRELGSAPPQPEHGSMSVGAKGMLTLTIGERNGDMSGKTLVMQPYGPASALQWDCTGGSLQPRYRMASCRGR